MYWPLDQTVCYSSRCDKAVCVLFSYFCKNVSFTKMWLILLPCPQVSLNHSNWFPFSWYLLMFYKSFLVKILEGYWNLSLFCHFLPNLCHLKTPCGVLHCPFSDKLCWWVMHRILDLKIILFLQNCLNYLNVIKIIVHNWLTFVIGSNLKNHASGQPFPAVQKTIIGSGYTLINSTIYLPPSHPPPTSLFSNSTHFLWYSIYMSISINTVLSFMAKSRNDTCNHKCW